MFRALGVLGLGLSLGLRRQDVGVEIRAYVGRRLRFRCWEGVGIFSRQALCQPRNSVHHL